MSFGFSESQMFSLSDSVLGLENWIIADSPDSETLWEIRVTDSFNSEASATKET